MPLPEELDESFDSELDRFEEENQMEYVTSIERVRSKRAMREGHPKGLLEGIALALDAKFGAAGLKVLRKTRALDDVAALRKFARFLMKAESLDEVREYFK
jgi:hypothetical protein